MEELVVTKLWMGGVICIMAAFGMASLIGHIIHKKRGNQEKL